MKYQIPAATAASRFDFIDRRRRRNTSSRGRWLRIIVTRSGRPFRFQSFRLAPPAGQESTGFIPRNHRRHLLLLMDAILGRSDRTRPAKRRCKQLQNRRFLYRSGSRRRWRCCRFIRRLLLERVGHRRKRILHPQTGPQRRRPVVINRSQSHSRRRKRRWWRYFPDGRRRRRSDAQRTPVIGRTQKGTSALPAHRQSAERVCGWGRWRLVGVSRRCPGIQRCPAAGQTLDAVGQCHHRSGRTAIVVVVSSRRIFRTDRTAK